MRSADSMVPSGVPVGRAGKNHLLEGHIRDVRGVIVRDLQSRKSLLSLALDFGGRESRVDNHVADQIVGQFGLVSQNAQTEVSAVPIDIVVNDSSHRINGLGYLPRAAARRAFR